MARNSKSRLGKDQDTTSKPAASDDPVAAVEAGGALEFATPTEFVQLPSGGKHYPEGHPLCGVDSLEIKFMTAKEEDILTSKTLIKQGVALERLLKSVIIDKRVDPSKMLTGDRNAVLVAARISGYGEQYNAKVACPACTSINEVSYDLSDVEHNESEDNNEVSWNSEGNMVMTLPFSGIDVEARLFTGKDEMYISRLQESKRRKKLAETGIQDVLSLMIVSVNGDDSKETLQKFINGVPARDVRHLREVYRQNTPNISMNHDFECESCNFGTVVEVPFTVEFFWPR